MGDQYIKIYNSQPKEEAVSPVLEAIIKPLGIVLLVAIIVWPGFIEAIR